VKPFQVTCGTDVLDENAAENWEGCRMTRESKEARQDKNAGRAGKGRSRCYLIR
jgi:hypothetical protein